MISRVILKTWKGLRVGFRAAVTSGFCIPSKLQDVGGYMNNRNVSEQRIGRCTCGGDPTGMGAEVVHAS